MNSLKPGKDAYVPENGIIYAGTVTFTAGETAFDLLKRICSSQGIALEYSYTPMYRSYYVEGIHHLYEFDCGSSSGWLYKVNGTFPNYGSSGYTVRDGDSISWQYTCGEQGTPGG